jgi:heme/copper-type cytochrome/quinol oxidase subunit 2
MSILNKKENRRKSDVYAFINIYIIPLILSILIAIEKILSKSFYDNIIIILAILVSVFLTLINILTSKSYKEKNEKQKKIINYTFNNVYFLTIISILLIILCFFKTSFSNLHINIIDNIPLISKIFTLNNCKIVFDTIVIYLIIEIIIHLLIVLKRIEQIFFITFDD